MSLSSSSARIYAAPCHNHLLDRMSAGDRDWLTQRMQRRAFTLNEILVRRDRPISQVFFPTGCIASVITQMDTGETVETGTVGNEGFTGIPLLLDAESTPNEVICQHEGDALVLGAADFRVALERSPAVRALLNRYAHTFLVQSSQATACNRLHEISQRCAKWMLMTHDRIGADEFRLTQEFMAIMLGVRRASVSVAAEELKQAGIITYHRGTITILDRTALEAAACECYSLTREEYDRLVG